MSSPSDTSPEPMPIPEGWVSPDVAARSSPAASPVTPGTPCAVRTRPIEVVPVSRTMQNRPNVIQILNVVPATAPANPHASAPVVAALKPVQVAAPIACAPMAAGLSAATKMYEAQVQALKAAAKWQLQNMAAYYRRFGIEIDVVEPEMVQGSFARTPLAFHGMVPSMATAAKRQTRKMARKSRPAPYQHSVASPTRVATVSSTTT